MRFIQEALQIVARHCKVAGLIRHCSSSKSGKVSVTSLMLRHPRRKYWDRSFVPSFCCMSPQVCSFSLTPQQPPSQIYFPLSQQNVFLPLSPPHSSKELSKTQIRKCLLNFCTINNGILVLLWKQCCGAETIYFWLRLHFFSYFGSGSGSSHTVYCLLKMYFISRTIRNMLQWRHK